MNWLHVLRFSLPASLFSFLHFYWMHMLLLFARKFRKFVRFFLPFRRTTSSSTTSPFSQFGENDSEAQAGDGTKNKYKNESRHQSHPKQEVTHELNAEILKWRIITRNEKRIRKEAKFRNIRDGPEVKWKKQAEMFKNTLTGAQKKLLGLYNEPHKTQST